MKLLIIFVLLFSCTKKYETYHIIDKQNFSKDNPEAPIIQKKIIASKIQTSEYCEGQIFFSSNAKAATDRSLNRLIDRACPSSRYLMNSKVTEVWWTTILYTRSCIELETYCPRD